jgi:hypothetical protein
VLNCGTLGEEAVAEEKASDLVDELNPRAGAGYPPLGFPTIFAEFVPTIILGPAVVKFYLMRADAPFMPGEADGGGTSKQTPVCQIVMPLENFVNTAVFFDRYLQNLISQNIVPQEFVDNLRGSLKTAQSPASVPDDGK